VHAEDDWPVAEVIETERLVLEPLRVDHAEEMAPALGDTALHTYTGGEPATLEQLAERYRWQAAGRSPDGTQGWLNWIARHRRTAAPVGTVQATLTRVGPWTHAEVAWVVAVPHQRQGYASEAAAAMVAWLRRNGVSGFTAHVHPDHAASAGVARRLRMHPTDTVVDGEIRWTS
jgi:RimJ/RimL family protein N-acetyltransferase